MKILRMISKNHYILEDDEGENIQKMWAEESKQPLLLRNGTMVNPACIESVGEAMDTDYNAYYLGNRMSKDKTKVKVDGEWKNFAGKPKDIEYKHSNVLCLDEPHYF